MEQKIIREIHAAQVDMYKSFIEKGFLEDQDFFRITPEDARLEGFPTTDSEDSFTLGFYVNNDLAGVVSFQREGVNRIKLRHKGLLFRMYVAKEYRGFGISKTLIINLLERIKGIDNIEQINLTVVANNTTARQLYEQFGFVVYGMEPKAIKWQGQYFDEIFMVLDMKRNITI
jgi:GNAT superfamily N-acetyltransferase